MIAEWRQSIRRAGGSAAVRRLLTGHPRKAFAILAFCALMVALALSHRDETKAVGAPVATSASQKGAVFTEFRPNESDYGGKLLVSLGFVVILALIGAVVVAVAKRRPYAGMTRAAALKTYGVRLLTFKRVSARLNVLVIEIGEGQVVAIADNGNSLLKLAEIHASTPVASSGDTDEK